VIDDTVTREVSVEVIFHLFVELRRQIAQAQVAFLVVPDNDFYPRAFFGIFAYPLRDLFVGRSGRNERSELGVVDPGEVEPALVERAIGMVRLASQQGLRGIFPSRRSRPSNFTLSRSWCMDFLPSPLFGLRRHAAVDSMPQSFGVSPAKRRPCATFSDSRSFDGAR
jgi:hypothetical protein